MLQAKTTREMMELVGGTNEGVFLARNEEAVAGNFISELSEHVGAGINTLVELPLGRGTVVSSPNPEVAAALIVAAKSVGAEVVRRLTLEDVRTLEGRGEIKMIGKPGREQPVLVIRIGETVIYKVILDHGFRKNARVLAVTINLAADGRSVTERYAIQQYVYVATGWEFQDGKEFDVVEGDLETAQLEVAEHKITGGKTRAKKDDEEDAVAANDNLQRSISAFQSFLYGLTGACMYQHREMFKEESQRRWRAVKSGRRDGRRGGFSIADMINRQQLEACVAPVADDDGEVGE